MPSNLGLGGGTEEELATESRFFRAAPSSAPWSIAASRNYSAIAGSRSGHRRRRFRARRRSIQARQSIVAGVNDSTGDVSAKHAAEIKMLDREDAIDDVVSRLTRSQDGGGCRRNLISRARFRERRASSELLTAIYMFRRRLSTVAQSAATGVPGRKGRFSSRRPSSFGRRVGRCSPGEVDPAPRPTSPARALAEETGALEAKLSEIRASEAALDSVGVTTSGRVLDPRRLARRPRPAAKPRAERPRRQIAKVETDRTLLLASST